MNQNNDKDGWWPLVNLLVGIKKPEQVDAILDLFLTPEEQAHLGARFLIVQNLLKGEKTQREIAKEHHVSISQITRGSNMLKRIGEETRNYLIKKVV